MMKKITESVNTASDALHLDAMIAVIDSERCESAWSKERTYFFKFASLEISLREKVLISCESTL